MSEPTEGGTAPAPEPTAPTEPARAETDWKAEARKWESRAKENKQAAERLAELEEANKSEAERAAERLAKAEQTAAEAEARALRRDIALEHSLSKDDAALLDAVTDEDAMRRLAERLARQATEAANHITNNGAYVPTEGKTPPALNSDQLEQALKAKLGIA